MGKYESQMNLENRKQNASRKRSKNKGSTGKPEQKPKTGNKRHRKRKTDRPPKRTTAETIIKDNTPNGQSIAKKEERQRANYTQSRKPTKGKPRPKAASDQPPKICTRTKAGNERIQAVFRPIKRNSRRNTHGNTKTA